jgi:hypothetical protein
MSLVKKTKIALDDSRTLMLGAQILLGFQLQAPFQSDFDSISDAERTISAVVLMLMIVIVGMLIAPSARHRIVEAGEATRAINRFITTVSIATLFPFAIALGLSIGLAATRIVGGWTGVVSGIIAAIVPAAIWYGPAAIATVKKEAAMPCQNEKTPISAKIEYVLTEARVVLPGAQALLGFQLAIVLTNAFAALDPSAKAIHGLALALIGFATVLLLAPAAYHRIVYDGADDPHFHRLASRLLLAATVFLALGLAADTYVVVVRITGSAMAGIWLAVAVALVLVGLWHVWPWWMRVRWTKRWP